MLAATSALISAARRCARTAAPVTATVSPASPPAAAPAAPAHRRRYRLGHGGRARHHPPRRRARPRVRHPPAVRAHAHPRRRVVPAGWDVDHRGLPPAVRPSHVPRLGAGPLVLPRLRRVHVPELGAVLERRPPRAPRRHRRSGRSPRHHQGRVVGAHGLALLPPRVLGRREPPDRPVRGAQRAPAEPLLRVPRHRARARAPDRHRLRRGAIRGAASSWPASSGAPCSCRPPSA